jgi:hypothetical protein
MLMHEMISHERERHAMVSHVSLRPVRARASREQVIYI